MPNAADFFSGKYVTANQLPTDRHITAVITSVAEEAMQMTGGTKLVLYLSTAAGKPHSKGIVLNVTNGKALSTAYGNDTDGWIGRQIELWAAPTTFAGKATMGIRIIPIGNGHSTPMPPSTPNWDAPGGSGLDDEMPF